MELPSKEPLLNKLPALKPFTLAAYARFPIVPNTRNPPAAAKTISELFALPSDE